MRQAPDHVLKAVRRYDSRAGLRWDTTAHVWYLTFDGRDCFVLEHPDGSPVMELYEGEILETMRRSDTYHAKTSFERQMARLRRRRRYRAQQVKESSSEAMHAEARKHLEFQRHGVTPMVSGACA